MNTLGHFKQTILPLLATIVLGCFMLLPQAQAVVPPPDGCYPNYTTAEGCSTLNFLTTGAGNSGFGWYALYLNATGNFNTGVGGGALALNNADSNTAVGAGTLLLNTTGTANTAVGTDALVYNDGGANNTANGAFALFSNTEGVANTAVGKDALLSNITGNFNTAIGVGSLLSNTTGNRNIALGQAAGINVETADDVICIGTVGENVSNSCYINNIWGQPIDPGTALTVGVDDNGKMGTTASSRRFKHNIKPMGKSSETILALKPVTFHYKSDTKGRPQFGLIAEEVAEMNPDLVVRDKEGKPYSVRYDQVNAMLLNEFLKEHRKNEAQEKTIAELKSEMTALIATVKEQAAQIQKVSAQLELTKSAPQTVLNNQ